jgi:exopolysaccharide production protein ExoQ
MRLPPFAASWFFAGFILFLIIRDAKTFGKMSPGLWIPIFWCGIISSKPVIYWFRGRDVESDLNAYLDGNPIDSKIFLGLIILGVIVLLRRPIFWGERIGQSRWLWILYFVLAVSCLWSDTTLVSFRRWIKEFGNVIMALIVMTEEDPEEAIAKVFLRCAYVLVPLSVLYIKWYPDIGRYYHRWTYETCYCGITTNKNSLGVLAMIGGLAVLWNLLERYDNDGGLLTKVRKRWDQVAVLLMCVWILSIARSATSFSCFAIGVLALLVARTVWVKSHFRLIIWFMSGMAMFMLAFTVMPGIRAVVAEALDRDVTLTGRTDIWAAALKLDTNPLLGAGFASVWLTPEGYAVAEELRIPHAHNGYLETYLNNGILGVVLLFGLIVSAGKKIMQQLSFGTKMASLLAAYFFACLIFNYTEVAFVNGNIIGFTLLLTVLTFGSGPVVVSPGGEDSMPVERSGLTAGA